MKLLTYINYDGHCREAFRFYEQQSRRKNHHDDDSWRRAESK
jgi:hypothetical protein